MTQPMPRGDLTAEAGTGLLVLVGGRAHVRGMAPVARPAFRQRKSTPRGSLFARRCLPARQRTRLSQGEAFGEPSRPCPTRVSTASCVAVAFRARLTVRSLTPSSAAIARW